MCLYKKMKLRTLIIILILLIMLPAPNMQGIARMIADVMVMDVPFYSRFRVKQVPVRQRTVPCNQQAHEMILILYRYRK